MIQLHDELNISLVRPKKSDKIQKRLWKNFVPLKGPNKVDFEQWRKC